LKQDANKKDFKQNWALVTGASAGIGAEFCLQLAALGYPLVLVARREQNLTRLATSLETEFAVKCRVFTADLSLPDASERLAARLEAEDVQIEFLVNNAGYGLPGKFTQASWQDHQDFIQVMTTAVCELTWRLLPAMQSRGKGYVVNVASLAGLVPSSAGHTLYGASKAFLVHFTESLAAENQSTGVKVSALCPGFTYSEFHDVSGTRDLVSEMPDWMWMKSDEVVEYGIKSVMREKTRIVAVPGRANRMIARLIRWLPMSVAIGLAQRQSKRFRHNESSKH
jgi:short-subunit dehydrogenase